MHCFDVAIVIGFFYLWRLPDLDFISSIEYPLLIVAGALLFACRAVMGLIVLDQ